MKTIKDCPEIARAFTMYIKGYMSASDLEILMRTEGMEETYIQKVISSKP